MNEAKYVKPKSLAWWASVMPLVGGLIIAFSKVFAELEPIATIVHELSGDMTAAQLVQLGLLGIGLRGAIS